ncbi:MAG: nodulation protein NfeD [Acidobacteria bacterium]|nr:nodulation protein NfeD [Acidobacteriota bacterium]
MRHAPRTWQLTIGRWHPAACGGAVALGLWLASGAAVATGLVQQGSEAPRVIVAEYDGIIHPIAAEFFDDVIARADASGAVASVIVLRTPGGLLESTRTMVSRMIAARTPVVVFVSPSGARAASAGFLITLAADVAAMSPGTHIGAAHPVAAGEQTPTSEVMSQKATADAAAYARTLAEARGRNTDLAAKAVTESAAFTEREALSAQPPLIDLVANDVDDLLRQLDGREIRRFDGRRVTLRTEGAVVERVETTWRQTVLGAIAHPQVAYLLLTLGMLGLMVEFWNPGALVPGVLGGLCLLLAFFAFQVLPVNLTGLLLLVFGIALLGAELMAPSFGVLGIGGIVALLAGSLMITREVPGVRVGYEVIVPVVLAVAAIVLGLGRLALRAQRVPTTTGAEGLIGERGQALSTLGPAEPGQVRVHGEIWRAVSSAQMPAGAWLRVARVEGLTLHVEALEPTEPPGGAP